MHKIKPMFSGANTGKHVLKSENIEHWPTFCLTFLGKKWCWQGHVFELSVYFFCKVCWQAICEAILRNKGKSCIAQQLHFVLVVCKRSEFITVDFECSSLLSYKIIQVFPSLYLSVIQTVHLYSDCCTLKKKKFQLKPW